MPIFLDTRGKSVLAVSICDRCRRKFPWTELMSDPNSPGLMVCRDDLDEYDPWRLPPRESEIITLQWARPDTPISTSPFGLLNEQETVFLLTEDGSGYLIP